LFTSSAGDCPPPIAWVKRILPLFSARFSCPPPPILCLSSFSGTLSYNVLPAPFFANPFFVIGMFCGLPLLCRPIFPSPLDKCPTKATQDDSAFQHPVHISTPPLYAKGMPMFSGARLLALQIYDHSDVYPQTELPPSSPSRAYWKQTTITAELHRRLQQVPPLFPQGTYCVRN